MVTFAVLIRILKGSANGHIFGNYQGTNACALGAGNYKRNWMVLIAFEK